jgi:hypothetical protein
MSSARSLLLSLFATAPIAALVAIGLPLAGACASDAASRRGDGAGSGDGAVRITDDNFDPSCCTVREFDLNRDGKPDAYQFVKVVQGEQVVVRKENDVNFDGRIDIIRILSDRGELVEERFDGDFDGRIDVVVFFEKGAIVRKERDTNFDQKTDVWVYFEGGNIAREEADLNYDGRVDYWEYFEGGRLDRVGIDRDNDGTVDEWLTQQQSEG